MLVGTRTALLDNPALDTRYGFVNQPAKLVIDMKGKLPPNLHLFKNPEHVLVFSEAPEQHPAHHMGARCFPTAQETLLMDILSICAQQGFNSLLVEGGAFTLRQFIEQDCWNEAFLVHTPAFLGPKGIAAPSIPTPFAEEVWIGDNRITRHENNGKMG
jgi:diaminohydroxyphosphoribosylaminopyrimidine deaminase/5-amino-6-(5-phosphoribosylamino)uracil reductase